MPPKKEVVEEVKGPWALGRFSNRLKVGIVGMPNVGKSTLYNTLTKCSIPAENFPFCTIDPNETRVYVPDERFDWLVDKYKPKSEVQPWLEIVDIAGLVKGAAQGAGLGNAFLSHIRAIDGIIHVLRAFDDPDIIHVEDRVDPIGDIEIITNELRAKDLEAVARRKADLDKEKSRMNSNPALRKEFEAEQAFLAKLKEYLEAGKEVRNGMDQWSVKEIEYLNDYSLLTAKPCMFLINLSEEDYKRKKNKWLAKIHQWVQEHGGKDCPLIPYSGAFESRMVDLGPEKAEEAQKEEGVVSVLPKIIKSAFTLVHLIYFFTAGPDEVKAWVCRKGSKAPQAAGTIHSDFEQGFICAEVMAFDDLKELGSEAEVKAKGKYRQEGKMYTVLDGDVIYFKFNVTTKKK